MEERLLGVIPAKCSTDANTVRAVCDSKAVSADDVDPVRLRHCADFTRVVNCDLFGDDDLDEARCTGPCCQSATADG